MVTLVLSIKAKNMRLKYTCHLWKFCLFSKIWNWSKSLLTIYQILFLSLTEFQNCSKLASKVRCSSTLLKTFKVHNPAWSGLEFDSQHQISILRLLMSAIFLIFYCKQAVVIYFCNFLCVYFYLFGRFKPLKRSSYWIQQTEQNWTFFVIGNDNFYKVPKMELYFCLDLTFIK